MCEEDYTFEELYNNESHDKSESVMVSFEPFEETLLD